MTYAGLQLFMNNLKELIYCKDNPLINSNPSISYERPQFQQLYEELCATIQILFIDQDQGLHELEKVRNLKKRFKQVAEEAQDTIDLFLSSVHFRNKGHFTRFSVFKRSLNLKEVIRSINSIKVEFIMIANNKIESSQVSDQLQIIQSATAAESSRSRKSSGLTKVLEETVVGLDHHVELIRDKLVEDRKQLDVISIVGMGGLGKTTLATKLFHDHYIVYHFHIRAWVTVSQTYDKQNFLIEILASIGVELDVDKATHSRLREMLYKSLKGKRYLIVIDDIWSSKAWDDLKLFFPNDDTGSRILLTSRLTEVALHANSHGFVYHLQYLTEEESWELLQKKVFQDNECPTWLIEPGMQIARSCQGLPLAVVVIAGVLANEVMSKYFWEKIAQRVTSYIIDHAHKGYVDTLALSIDHLPLHLRDCFLYLGGFAEDYKLLVRRLIWLWVAEGFIQEDGNRTLEEIAEEYLMDLVDRNLLIVTKRKFNGGVKACTVHDLVRELCLEKATKENFCLKIHKPMSYYPVEVIMTHKQRHVFTYNDLNIMNLSNPPIPSIRSLLCFHRNTSKIFNCDEYIHPYVLLMVLDLEKCTLDRNQFPEVIALLVHLRYLAIWYPSRSFPSSICNLWNLQTLIVKTDFIPLMLPSTISNLVNLRHLWSDGDIYFPLIQKPMKLQTISNVKLGDGAECWLKCFPGIKKLTCPLYTYEENDFKSLDYLKSLKLIGSGRRKKSMELNVPKGEPMFEKNHFTLPSTLRKLTLMWCRLPWSDILMIQMLPNLEELNLLENAFQGPQWDTGGEQFQQLKFLKLHNLDIQRWQASNINFPHLKRLVLLKCNYLEEIPLEIGEISTLELIETDDISSIIESLERIEEEQHNVGNYDLKIRVHRQRSQNRNVLDEQPAAQPFDEFQRSLFSSPPMGLASDVYNACHIDPLPFVNGERPDAQLSSPPMLALKMTPPAFSPDACPFFFYGTN